MEEAAAGSRRPAGTASRLDTIAAPTRHVRVTNLSSEDCWEATEADGTAAACTGATAALGPAAGSRLDTITAPIRHVRVVTLSPDCC